MNVNKTDLRTTAKNSTRIITVMYVLLKVPLYMLDMPQELWMPRIVTCAIMLFFAFFITGSKLSRRMIAILTPLSLALPETIWCAIFQKGEWLLYIFLIGCALIGLLYLDTVAFIISATINTAVLVICSFVFGIVMTGSTSTSLDDLFALAGMLLINLLIFFICKDSVGAFTKFTRTGQTFDMILDTTPSHMVVINEDARVEYISGALAQWLGVSRREYALNRPLMDLCRSGELKLMFQDVMEQTGSVEKHYELTIGGVRYWFLLRSSLLGGGKVSRTFELNDITPIMEAKNVAEAATNAKSSFLANMSHEIRTPMNAVVGMAELLALKPLDLEQQEQVSAIKGAAMSLLNIINDILDFSKIDAEKMEIISKPFDIMSLINDTINIINIKVSGTDVAFTVQMDNKLPARIDGDELRIKQILLNILNNAVKFTKKGCVELSVSSTPIDGGLVKLAFSISDTGIGMRKEEMENLFEAFAQLDTRKNRDITGTGLGLAITRRLVELMGGFINVDSEYGKGTVFSFYILCRDAEACHVASLLHPQNYRVLCFEPNAYHAKTLKATFKSLGVDCSVYEDLTDFENRLHDGKYSHIFYNKTALQVIERLPENFAHFVLMKGIRDNSLPVRESVVNRPVLITSVAQMLEGRSAAESGGEQHSELRLGAFETRGVRALLVDDNSVNLMVADGMLRQYGIGVVTAMGGQESVDKIQTGEFDIVFMDHMMPDMDGIDATKAIRTLGGYFETVPIIALSANAISGVEQLFLDAGMNGFISKPIIIGQLHNVLLEHLPPEKVYMK